MADSNQKSHYNVLGKGLGGGPHGLGNPDDMSLRKVEEEILIPQKMKKKAKKLCNTEVQDFTECGKENGLMLPFKCRKQAKNLEICLGGWYHDEQFKDECRKEYLEERTFYRRTGIKQKFRNKQAVDVLK